MDDCSLPIYQFDGTSETDCHAGSLTFGRDTPCRHGGNLESQRQALAVENLQTQSRETQESSVSGTPVESGVPCKLTLRDLPVWGQKNAYRITLLSRAISGAKRSLYRDVDDIFLALDFLAGPYRDHRLNTLGEKAYEAALLALRPKGFQITRSADPSVAGRNRSAYFVDFQGHKRFLNWHIQKGNIRNARFCLRIYFFWDDRSKQVVVGSLPAHLDNSLS